MRRMIGSASTSSKDGSSPAFDQGAAARGGRPVRGSSPAFGRGMTRPGVLTLRSGPGTDCPLGLRGGTCCLVSGYFDNSWRFHLVSLLGPQLLRGLGPVALRATLRSSLELPDGVGPGPHLVVPFRIHDGPAYWLP